MNPPEINFRSLPAQVTRYLRDEIARGAWREWLPSERVLTETLQVSRKTVAQGARPAAARKGDSGPAWDRLPGRNADQPGEAVAQAGG